MRSAYRFALAVILALGSVAHADTIFNFSATFNGVPNRGYPPTSQATGTLTIDTVNGVVTAANIQTAVTSFIYVNYTQPTGDYLVIELINQNPPFPILPCCGISDLGLILPVNSLVGYTGGLGCSNTYMPMPGCLSGNSEQFTEISVVTEGAAFAETVSLTPAVIQTPEPNSLLLLGTGLLAIVAPIRYRYRPSAE